MNNGNGRWQAVLLRGLGIGLLTFILAAPVGYLSDTAARRLVPALGFVVLGVVIAIGVVFDMVGLAVAVSDEKPFHAMAAKRIGAASHAMRLVRHADKVSSFTNDVIGDIAGTVSGAVAAAIILHFVALAETSYSHIITGLFVSLAAALTAGGKAAGKKVAIARAFEITLFVGRVTSWVERRLGIDVLRLIDNGNGRRGSRKGRRNSQK